MNIAFFGSSLVSAYWNGAATYYRGILKALHERGHQITFYEPDAFERQAHRDIAPPDWARVVVYENQPEAALQQVARARGADLLIKASGVGVFDELLEAAVLEARRPGAIVAFWDVDAPATLERVLQQPEDAFRALVPNFDLVFTYGGGPRVVQHYKGLGARDCVPIYNALDPSTHFPVPADARFQADLSFLGNRLPDREVRVEEFFFSAARRLPSQRFLLGGSGWERPQLPSNVAHIGHVYTADHNALNCGALAVLNVCRSSMMRYGFSPATRVFEAAGAGACIISDAWEGVEHFFEPESEILLARSGAEVAAKLTALSVEDARKIGRRAYLRTCSEHTYSRRAAQIDEALGVRSAPVRPTSILPAERPAAQP